MAIPKINDGELGAVVRQKLNDVIDRSNDQTDSLEGGATGQVLRKTGNGDLEFDWETLEASDVGAATDDHTHGAIANNGHIAPLSLDEDAGVLVATGPDSNNPARVLDINNLALNNRFKAIDVAAGLAGRFSRLDGITYSATSQVGDNSAGSTNLAANSIQLIRFVPNSDITVSQVGLVVDSRANPPGSQTCRVVLYSSDDAGYPDELLFESAGIGIGDTTGEKLVGTGFAQPGLTRGRAYWFGIHPESQFGTRSKPQSVSTAFGYSGLNTSFTKIVRTGIPYAGGAPAVWNFVPGELSGGALPDVRYRHTTMPIAPPFGP